MRLLFQVCFSSFHLLQFLSMQRGKSASSLECECVRLTLFLLLLLGKSNKSTRISDLYFERFYEFILRTRQWIRKCEAFLVIPFCIVVLQVCLKFCLFNFAFFVEQIFMNRSFFVHRDSELSWNMKAFHSCLLFLLCESIWNLRYFFAFSGAKFFRFSLLNRLQFTPNYDKCPFLLLKEANL